MRFLKSLFKGKLQKDNKVFPPIPQWQPNTPVNHEQIMEAAKYYTGGKVQLAVFQYGTVVMFPEAVTDITEEAKLTLHKIYNAHPDFKPLNMDDGNYLIEYSYPAFTVVFKNEPENYWDYIEDNHQQGVCPDEVLINSNGEHNVFDRIGKISLFGRARMFMDAQAPQVVKTFTPLLANE
ncbi:hypothetical protein KHS38_15070 [Mucilaginibacter sp. Bleaf8]|uniref:hypothetical protein n=1 Tax=Mucilaginibacter sp. Bleaf8 TaxID=2834430 RepID=UPI001BD07208|nr:hypothetical protein [Mucilaginibacter sp. Bleaf8]MBS7565731.1 hypothetical protein [Mucilaginibacter sp. Bleaf8]